MTTHVQKQETREMLRAVFNDLTTGEALFPEQQEPIANIVADAEAEVAALQAENERLREALQACHAFIESKYQGAVAEAIAASVVGDELRGEVGPLYMKVRRALGGKL